MVPRTASRSRAQALALGTLFQNRLPRPALRGTPPPPHLPRGSIRSVGERRHRRLEPHAYRLQHGAVGYPFLHARHQTVVRDAIEVPLQIGVVDGAVAFLQVPLDRFERVHGRAPRTKAVGTGHEIRFENRFQNQLRGALDNTITQGGNAQRALPPVGLGDAHPPHRSRPVAPRLPGSAAPSR